MSEASVTISVDRTPTIKVYERAAWTDEWAEIPYVVVESVVSAAAPTISQARCRFDYGEIKREDSASFSEQTPLDLKNHFIRIDAVYNEGSESEVTSILFYGVVPSETLELHSSRNDIESGRYKFIALGLEYLLDNFNLYQADVDDGSGSVVRLNTTIPFNEQIPRGVSEFGNRSNSKSVSGGQGTYVFSKDYAEWSAGNIAEHLIIRSLTNGIAWEFTGQTQVLDILTPKVLDLGGQTIRQSLNMLIDRRRCAGWKVKVDELETVSVDVFSVLGESINEAGVSLPANLDVTGITLDDDRNVQGAFINVETATKYDWIVIRGERVKSLFTVGVNEGSSLEPAWTSEEESAYADADDEARTNDEYRHVYTTFVIPDDYDYGDKNPTVFGDGTVDPATPAPIRKWGRSLLRQLPLGKPWSDIRAEFVEPFVVVLRPDEEDKYIFADRLDAIDLQSYGLRMLDSEAGIELTAPVNHTLALNTFSGESATLPEVDFNTAMATVAMDTDHHLEYVVKIGGTATPERTLVIDVPNAECWWVSPNTVTGLDDEGELVREVAGFASRNDIGRLREVGALARAWYGVQRAAINTTFKGVVTNFPVGTYIADTESAGFIEPVNSVVTAVTYDLVNFQTTIQTGYQELDFGALAN